MSHQNNSNRIAKNTAVLYFRLLLTMGISLYTSRIILQALGVSDFGIYNVVGGVVSMLSFFTSSISSSFQRFFCVEIGRNDTLKLSKLVGSSVLILICLSVFVFLIAETLGMWFVREKLVFPTEKMPQAVIVFRFSVLTFIVSLFQSMYNAIIISYEKMNVFAYISIFDVISRLLIAWSIQLFIKDRLIYYSAFVFVSSLIMLSIYYLYCRFHYKAAKAFVNWNLKMFMDIFKFSGWTLLGTFANVLKSNGINILLNVFFGPVVNAARGIAYQVYTAVNSFTRSFQVAFTPQITKSYSQEDYKYVQKLMFSSSKMSLYLILILSIPIFIDTGLVLHVWLGDNVPDYTESFVKIVILTGFVESLSAPVVNVIYASGRIKKFQIAVSAIIICVIPLSYVLLKIGYSPVTALLVSLALTVVAHFVRLYFVRGCLMYSFLGYLKEIILPMFLFSFFLILLPTILFPIYTNGVINYLLTVVVVEIIIITVIYKFGLSKAERGVIKNKLISFKRCKS